MGAVTTDLLSIRAAASMSPPKARGTTTPGKTTLCETDALRVVAAVVGRNRGRSSMSLVRTELLDPTLLSAMDMVTELPPLLSTDMSEPSASLW